MNTHYHWKRMDKSQLESWLADNHDIIDRCLFNTSWRWERTSDCKDSKYVCTVSIHLCDSQIHHDYDIQSNKAFFDIFNVEKAVGKWMGELSHELSELLSDKGLYASCSMRTQDGCFVRSQCTSIENAERIAQLIQESFGLFTKICRVGKGEYDIFIHRDKSILDSLKLPEPASKTRKTSESDESLKLREAALLAELAKIRKKLSNT